jgi:maltodextrin utilization protein YvdJ
LGFLLIVAISLSALSSIPVAYADAEVDAVDESTAIDDVVAEAVVDSAGDVVVDVQETPDDDNSAATEAEAAPVVTDEEPAAEEATPVVDDEVAVSESTTPAFVSNVRAKVVAIADKAKEVTPEQMKKVALGALGIWGVAAGAGWVMNNLGGSED